MRKPLRILALALPWIALLVLTVAAQAPGLKGGFFFDDHPNIVENHAVHIQHLSLDTLRASIAGPGAGPLGRPVSVLSFALTHYFFGLDPFAFKAINLAIHLINGLLVAWLATLLLRSLNAAHLSETAATWLPLWVAAAWLVHPINTVPILLAVQRMTLLSGLFMLLALIAHLKAMEALGKRAHWGWLAAGWLIFWPLSILSKETGLLFPLYVLAITLFSRPGPQSRPQEKPWLIPSLLFILLTIAIAMLWFLGRDWLNAAYSMRTFSLAERLLTETRVLWFYAAQILIPNYAAFGFYLDDFALSTGLLQPAATSFAVIGWAAVVLAIWRYRRHHAILCFSGTWFLVGHSLESTFLPLEIAHEYRNYLPSIGLILGIGYLGAHILPSLKMDYRRLTTASAATIAILVLALLSWLRADQLSNPLTGAQTEATRHPQSARANHAAALAMIKAGYGDADDAAGAKHIRFYLEQSEALDPAFKVGYLGLIIWACASDRPVEKPWLDGLAQRLEQTPFSPRDKELPNRLLTPLLSMPKCLSRPDALRLFAAGAGNPRIGVPLRARFLEAASNFELLVLLDPGSARNFLVKAADLSPDDPVLRRRIRELEFPVHDAPGASPSPHPSRR